MHNNGGNSNIKTKTMNASITTDPKKALLKALHRAESNGATPLRTKLDEAGKYYECTSNNIFGTAPQPMPHCHQCLWRLLPAEFHRAHD